MFWFLSRRLSWVFWLIQTCRRNTANGLFLAAWEKIPALGNDPAVLHCNDSAVLIVKTQFQSGWQSIAAAAGWVHSHQLRHRWLPSLCGRGSCETIATAVGSFLASALLPLGSRGLPACPLLSPSFTILEAFCSGSSQLGRGSHVQGPAGMRFFSRSVCRASSAASSEEAVAALRALLLDERRVFSSNKPTDGKAVAAFSAVLHINWNVVKYFFVPFSTDISAHL